MIINVYFCDGIVSHVVQIGCAKIWCQSYLFGPAVQMYVEMSWGGGGWWSVRTFDEDS